MTTPRTLGLLILAGALLLGAGCGESPDSPSFTVRNDSGEHINYLAIANAGPLLNFTHIEHRGELTRSYSAEALPRTVTVYWEDHEKTRHQKEVELWKFLPSDYVGPVTLTLNHHMKIRVSRT